MLWSFVYRKFPKDYVPTVFETHSVQINQNGESYTLSLFDTAGQVNKEINKKIKTKNRHSRLKLYFDAFKRKTGKH
jgi:GTPase SAR1 family protein